MEAKIIFKNENTYLDSLPENLQKNVLRHLNDRALVLAKLVCKNWKQCVDKFVNERTILFKNVNELLTSYDKSQKYQLTTDTEREIKKIFELLDILEAMKDVKSINELINKINLLFNLTNISFVSEPYQDSILLFGRSYVEAGSESDKEKLSVLEYAVYHGHKLMLQVILKNDASANLKINENNIHFNRTVLCHLMKRKEYQIKNADTANNDCSSDSDDEEVDLVLIDKRIQVRTEIDQILVDIYNQFNQTPLIAFANTDEDAQKEEVEDVLRKNRMFSGSSVCSVM